MPSDDWFTKAFGDAVADIRQKLVEEGWFGRPLIARPEHRGQSLDEALGWAHGPKDDARDPELGRAPEIDRGQDIAR